MNHGVEHPWRKPKALDTALLRSKSDQQAVFSFVKNLPFTSYISMTHHTEIPRLLQVTRMNKDLV